MKKVFRPINEAIVLKLWIEDGEDIPEGYYASPKEALASLNKPGELIVTHFDIPEITPEKRRPGRPRKP